MDAEVVARLVLDAYAALPTKFQVKPTEWTVLAGIVAFDSNTCEYRLISMATGTKCNGFPDSPVDPYALRDCHAEAIARRGLLLVLWKDLQTKQNTETILLESVEVRGEEDSTPACKRNRLQAKRFRLKPHLSLHMFISDLPCGTASEFARISGESRRITGAKPIAGGSNGDSLHLLCTKPGRSDLPEHKKTRCMSCSDKLMKWTSSTCGIQGALLSRAGLETPLLLNSIILSQDAALSALETAQFQSNNDNEEEERVLAKQVVRESMQQCLSRGALETRSCSVFVTDSSFPQSRQRISPPTRDNSSKGSPSGACLSLICVANGKRVFVPKAGGFVEMLVGMRGVREGASKSAPSRAVASDLCKASFFELFRQVCPDADSPTTAITTQSYLQAKQLASDYALLRGAFLASFPAWNVNSKWDEFHL